MLGACACVVPGFGRVHARTRKARKRTGGPSRPPHSIRNESIDLCIWGNLITFSGIPHTSPGVDTAGFTTQMKLWQRSCTTTAGNTLFLMRLPRNQFMALVWMQDLAQDSSIPGKSQGGAACRTRCKLESLMGSQKRQCPRRSFTQCPAWAIPSRRPWPFMQSLWLVGRVLADLMLCKV